jgi:hypothetical protein
LITINIAFGWFPLLLKFRIFLRMLECVLDTVGRFLLLLEWFHVVEGGFPYHSLVFSNWQLTICPWVCEYQGQFNGSDQRFDQPKNCQMGNPTHSVEIHLSSARKIAKNSNTSTDKAILNPSLTQTNITQSKERKPAW